MYVLKLNDIFFSDREHASDLCDSAELSNRVVLMVDLECVVLEGSYVQVYIFTQANLDDYHAVLSELEVGIGSVNSRLFCTAA